MNIKLSFADSNNPAFVKEELFEKFPISIGRIEENDLPLKDDFNIISRKHAKIIFEKNNFYLIDLKSSNYTYLNESKLDPDEKYAIKEKDKITIGNYDISVKSLDTTVEPKEDLKRTVIFSDIFNEEINDLIAALSKINEKYVGSDEKVRDISFNMSISRRLPELEKKNYDKNLIDFLSNFLADIGSKKKADESSKPKVSASTVVEETEVVPEVDDVSSKEFDGITSDQLYFSKMFDLFLESFAKLLRGLWQFNHEFFGVTFFQSLPVESLEKVKKHLLAPDLSQDEKIKRLKLLKKETNNILRHQISLLQGYQYSIDQGTRKLLEDIDPLSIEKEISQKVFSLGPIKIPVRIFPRHTAYLSLNALKEKFSSLFKDINSFQKDYFRSAFVKGYRIFKDKTFEEK